MSPSVFIHLALGALFRILFYYSKYKNTLSDLLLFPSSPYNYNNLRENYFYNLFSSPHSSFYSPNTFISKPLTYIYNQIRTLNHDYIFIFFLICDLLIALSLYKIKNSIRQNNQIKEEYNSSLIAIYLYNPVSITACITFRLDIIYSLINLSFIIYSNNYFIAPMLLVTSTIISPGYIIISIVYIIFSMISNFEKIKNTIFLSILLFSIYFYAKSLLNYDTIENITEIYYNYFYYKDTQPNFNFIWSLLPGTFLKYQKYTLDMILIYQFSIAIAVMLLVYRIQDRNYNYKNSLSYSMIFLSSHIFDRYPSEIHYIICLILLLQHYNVVKVKVIDLSLYCTFAGYTLIVCRGFPFTHRKSGTSNYLFFQNITYSVAMSFLLMCCVNGINNFRKENKMRKELKEENKNKKKKNKYKRKRRLIRIFKNNFFLLNLNSFI
jgi:hypothetical protein